MELVYDKNAMMVGLAARIEIDLFEDAEALFIEGKIDGDVGRDWEDIVRVRVVQVGWRCGVGGVLNGWGRIVEGGRGRGEVDVVVVGWGGGRGVKELGRGAGGVDIIRVRRRPESLVGRHGYVGGRGGSHG